MFEDTSQSIIYATQGISIFSDLQKVFDNDLFFSDMQKAFDSVLYFSMMC